MQACICVHKASDGSGFGDMQFATDYNNGITYVMNVLSMRVGSGRQFRVHDGSGRVQKRVRKVATPLRELACHVGTRCYLPPGRGDIPALTAAEAGTRFSDPRGCKAELT